eukprot:128702-Prymnesium_polylepis.1
MPVFRVLPCPFLTAFGPRSSVSLVAAGLRVAASLRAPSPPTVRASCPPLSCPVHACPFPPNREGKSLIHFKPMGSTQSKTGTRDSPGPHDTSADRPALPDDVVVTADDVPSTTPTHASRVHWTRSAGALWSLALRLSVSVA